MKYGHGDLSWYENLSHDDQVRVLAHEMILVDPTRARKGGKKGGGGDDGGRAIAERLLEQQARRKGGST